MRLLTLFGGFSLAGGLLTFQQVSPAIWLIVEGIVVYLVWAGTGAIALSAVGITAIMWALMLMRFNSTEDLWVGNVMFNPAQVWALVLILGWLLALVLTFRLAFVSQNLSSVGVSKITVLCVLVLTVNLGLKLGHLIEIKIASGQ